MLKPIFCWIGIALAGAGSFHAARRLPPSPGGIAQREIAQKVSSNPDATTVSRQRALLNQYCVNCHNERLRTADLMLDKLDVENIDKAMPQWERVTRKLRTGAMPPAGAPRPDKSSYESLSTYLESELDREAAAHPNPGRTPVRRLNRAEYSNAVRDLLALDTDAIDVRSLLPPDDSMHGFDNVGDGLTVSPLLLERSLSAARKITRLAIGELNIQPVVEAYTLPKYLMQDDRMSEDLPFGTRGGTALRHYFPADGTYVVKIRLQRNAREYIRGLAEPRQLELRLDGESIGHFKVGGEIRGRDAGLFSRGNLGDPAQEEYERITGDDGLEVRINVKAGKRIVGVAFLKETSIPEGPLEQRLSQVEFAQYKGGDPGVGTVTIAGPYDATGLGDTPSRQRIFICHPSDIKDEEACARKIISSLARHAYRRPLTNTDVDTLVSFFKEGRKAGDFEAGVAAMLERILIGPEFLFHVELDPNGVAPNTVYQISAVELASRLSFFLWSSIPDEELLGLAESGRLRDPVVLEQQVRRMLADSRSKAFVSNFAGQWLLLRNLRTVEPDPDVFPYFDYSLREAFQQETELFFGSIVREDRSMMDLLNANYTFLNQRLAEYYNIPNVYGNHFRRVQLTDDNRRGLLGQGSVLTVTSYANRTSPVFRGKWVLENILGTPPPPPPPNVPALKETASEGKILSMRERMEEHRANAVCAACHQQMDPLGFALENFDGIGGWRTTDAGNPIDSSGILPDGTKFQGPAELRAVLLSRPEQFVSTITEKILIYALGRGLDYYDAPAVRKIVRNASPNNYRWSSIVLGIVKSTPFQMRRSRAS